MWPDGNMMNVCDVLTAVIFHFVQYLSRVFVYSVFAWCVCVFLFMCVAVVIKNV